MISLQVICYLIVKTLACTYVLSLIQVVFQIALTIASVLLLITYFVLLFIDQYLQLHFYLLFLQRFCMADFFNCIISSINNMGRKNLIHHTCFDKLDEQINWSPWQNMVHYSQGGGGGVTGRCDKGNDSCLWVIAHLNCTPKSASMTILRFMQLDLLFSTLHYKSFFGAPLAFLELFRFIYVYNPMLAQRILVLTMFICRRPHIQLGSNWLTADIGSTSRTMVGNGWPGVLKAVQNNESTGFFVTRISFSSTEQSTLKTKYH